MVETETGPVSESQHGSLRRRLLPRTILRILIPGLLRRLDRWLLLHKPLLWRTQVHYFIWLSLVLTNVFLFSLSWLYPVSRTSVPAIEEVGILVTGLQVAGGLVLLLWCLGQYRSTLAEIGLRGYLLTSGFYAACFFMILTNPLSFGLPIVHRIASVTPDGEFAEEYTFHEQFFDFRCCHPRLNDDQIVAHEEAIRTALKKYGSSEQLKLNELCQPAPKHRCLILGSTSSESLQNPSQLLANVFNSIAAAKNFRAGTGIYYERYVASLPLYLISSILLGALLTLISLFPSIRNRQLGMTNGRFGLFRFRLPELEFFAQLDCYLRIHSPLVWSTGLHSFRLLFTAYGIWGLGIFLVIVASFTAGAHDFGELMESIWFRDGTEWLVLIPPGIWAIRQARAPLEATTLLKSQVAFLLYFIGAFLFQTPLLLVMVSATGYLPDNKVDNAWDLINIAAISTLWIAATTFVGKYLGVRLLFAVIFLGLSMFFGSLLLVCWLIPCKEETSFFFTAGLGIVGALAISVSAIGWKRSSSRSAPLLAGNYVIVSSLLLSLIWYSYNRNKPDEIFVESLDISMIVFLALVIALYVTAWISAFEILTKLLYYPRS